MARIFGTPDSKLICVYPTVAEKRTGWTGPEGERFVTAILDELKRTYRIDTNRVYLAGHSMGGYGTWSVGGKHADLFAAAAPMAGGVYERGVVPNFRNLPLRVYNAEDDQRVKPDSSIRAFERIDQELRPRHGGYPAVFHLYPPKDRIGHGFPRKRGHDIRSIFAWMLEHRRDPRPEHVVWEPSLSWKRHFYWLFSARGSGVIDVRRDGNTFTVSGGRGDLWIQLDKKLCDLNKPVVVKERTRDGEREVFRGLPKLSLRVLVESVGVRNDPEMAYVARVRVR
ncbi:MAG: prolyl oligopeptidase family serine peptidase [Planctomycetes bacterium]|nr:prolyl oligopeptidase family serine peptidase [Planctomycetota bacterium]